MYHFRDAQQQALVFLQNQLSIIEPTVYEIQYPDVQYRQLVPVVTEGNEWLKSITYYSMDSVGRAEWFHHYAKDIPLADVSREKFEQTVHMAAIGYRYTMEELAIGAALGQNLGTERAEAARRISEEFVDDVALRGDAALNLKGLINRSDVTIINVAADGTGSSPYWAAKDDAKIIRDFNAALLSVRNTTLTMEYADTVLLPDNVLLYLAGKQFGALQITLLEWLRQNNVYTLTTQQPLNIMAVRGLETADALGGGRAVFYRRDRNVLQMHVPMPHRFLDVWRTGPMIFDVPGIMRLGGLEIRRPSSVRYVDGVSAGPIT